jgi:hypothetical protein
LRVWLVLAVALIAKPLARIASRISINVCPALRDATNLDDRRLFDRIGRPDTANTLIPAVQHYRNNSAAR